MLLLDAFFRYSSVSLLLLIALLVLRDGKAQTTPRYAALVALTVAALLISLTPPELKLPAPYFMIFHFIDAPSIAFIWWLGLSMFQEDFKLGVKEWLGFSVYTGLMLYYRLAEMFVDLPFPPGFDLAADTVIFGLMAHLFIVTIAGHASDLIEPRRRLRLFFVIGLVVGASLIVAVENFFFESHPSLVALFRVVIIFPLTVWAVLWLTAFRPEKLTFRHRKTSPESSKIDPRDKTLAKNLLLEMEEKNSFLQRNLTISLLAKSLQTPEHRLRVLINRGLGYRNFNDFLNHYRIAAIKMALNNSENSRVPILSLALDAGYNSLAPFNRAFLKGEGMTPSQYRAQLAAKAD